MEVVPDPEDWRMEAEEADSTAPGNIGFSTRDIGIRMGRVVACASEISLGNASFWVTFVIVG